LQAACWPDVSWKIQDTAIAMVSVSGDRDRDGVSNRADRDRDGDGVRNSQDRRPDDPRRY